MTEKEIWQKLYTDQWYNASVHAVTPWVNGCLNLKLHKMPLLEDIAIPHWRIQPIVGKSPEPIFWYRLSRGIFNVNMKLREESQLAYLEERDYFHDVFGHTPMLFHPEYTNFVKSLGLLAQYVKDKPEALKALSNFYWFIPEFGLMEDNFRLKVLGAGILSSVDELQHVMGEATGMPTTVEINSSTYDLIAEMPSYITNGFQEQYFVLQSWGQLKDILKYLWTRYA